LAGTEDQLHTMAGDEDLKKQVKHKLDAFEVSSLFYLAFAVGCLYTARAIISYIILPFDQAVVFTYALFPSILYSFSIVAAYKFNKIPSSKVRMLIVILGSLVTFNVFYLLHLTGNLIQLYFSCMILIAFGMGAPTFKIWLLFAISFVTVYVASLFTQNVEILRPYLAVLVVATALSTVIYFIRVPSIRKLLELQIIHAENAKKLELSIKARDQFLANMTHELRTPMTGVMGMIDLLADTKLTEEQTYYLGTARKSARYLLTVINDILDVAKLEAGKVVISNENFDAVAHSKDIVRLFELRAKSKGLRLHLELPEQGLLPVNGDIIRISQILLNLLENALKFTEKGEITLRLEVINLSEKTTLTWSIEDTGVGISSDRLPNLFDRFEQIDSSTTRAAAGTGLGLAIVRDLVHLMDGKLGATSEIGAGSKFWFTLHLPTVDIETVSKANSTNLPEHFSAFEPIEFLPPTSMEKASNQVVSTSREIRILFAEDNPVNRELITRMLKREGWNGTPVTNGQEAVDAVQEGPNGYDLILMDIQMPVMDGISALNLIRQGHASALPIIALTANTLPDDILKYEEAGFDAIVGKPINIVELRTAVQKLTKSSNNDGKT
jgi:signal transduction histidine kinase/CheY-like chemotaxis protein